MTPTKQKRNLVMKIVRTPKQSSQIKRKRMMKAQQGQKKEKVWGNLRKNLNRKKKKRRKGK